jgi:hypothetical protein
MQSITVDKLLFFYKKKKKMEIFSIDPTQRPWKALYISTKSTSNIIMYLLYGVNVMLQKMATTSQGCEQWYGV